MAVCEFCLQDGGNAAFLRVLRTRWRRGNFAARRRRFWGLCLQNVGVGVLHTRWRRERFAYKITAMPHFWAFYPQDGGVGDLPKTWRRFWEFYLEDGSVSEGLSDPTRWRRGRFAHKITAMPRFWEVYPQDGGDKQNVNKNNTEEM